VLAAYDHLVAARGAPARRHAVLAAGYLPFFGVLGRFPPLRRRIFGELVGGYAEYSQRLRAPQLRQLAADLAASIHQLHVPWYGRWPGAGTLAVSMVLVLGVPLVFWLLQRRSLGA